MSIHSGVDQEIDGILELLRAKIAERGFSQVKVQAQLGWKGSYLSQLFNKSKNLRVEQMLLILRVIEVEPIDFYSEFYRVRENLREAEELDLHPEMAADEVLCAELSADVASGAAPSGPRPSGAKPSARQGFFERFFRSFLELRSLLRGVVYLLVRKGIISMDELKEAAITIKKGPTIVPSSWSDES